MSSPNAPASDAVVVVGGGAAGIAAAIGAARTGARTILVERYGFLGGMGTAGMVGTVCGLYFSDDGGDDKPVFVNEGFAAEFAAALTEETGEGPHRYGRVHVLPYSPPAFQRTADRLCATPDALEVRLHTTVTAVDATDDEVRSVRLLSWEGTEEIDVAAVVDASGDAMAALLAGGAVDTRAAGERQLPSLVFHVQGVQTQLFERGPRIAALRRVRAAEADGLLPPGSHALSFRITGQPGEVCAKLALDPIPGGAAGFGAAEVRGREIVAALERFFRTEVSGFENSFLSHTAPQIGVRESRTIVGRYELTREDVLGEGRFDDAVARAAWPIELWQAGAARPHLDYLPAHSFYEIPRRALAHRSLRNLFAAGRCISATHEALGSARVMGTCFATGYAAGRAAVLHR